MGLLRQLTILWFAVLFTTVTSAKDYADTTSTTTVLFKITKQGSDYVSYLFGTHHAFGKTFFDSLMTTNRFLSSSDLLIKENLNLPGHTATEIINKRSVITNWKRYLGKEDLIFISKLFAASPTDFNKMTPTELYAFLNRHFKARVCLGKSTSDTYSSLDDYIGYKAEQQNIKLIGLETTEEQIALLNNDVAGMPKRVHKKRLSNIIANLRSQDVKNCSETDWYREMNIDYKLHVDCGNTLVLTDRNNKWMGTIQGLIERNNCFIAVGLSHLMYSCGLIAQLRKLGYSVVPEPVK